MRVEARSACSSMTPVRSRRSAARAANRGSRADRTARHTKNRTEEPVTPGSQLPRAGRCVEAAGRLLGDQQRLSRSRLNGATCLPHPRQPEPESLATLVCSSQDIHIHVSHPPVFPPPVGAVVPPQIVIQEGGTGLSKTADAE